MTETFSSLNTGNIQVVKDRDASYFKIYSKREYYIRKIDPIEVEEGLNMGQNVNSDAFVLVGQMAPGVRTRLIFTDRDNPPIAEFTIQKSQFVDLMPNSFNPHSALQLLRHILVTKTRQFDDTTDRNSLIAVTQN